MKVKLLSQTIWESGRINYYPSKSFKLLNILQRDIPSGGISSNQITFALIYHSDLPTLHVAYHEPSGLRCSFQLLMKTRDCILAKRKQLSDGPLWNKQGRVCHPQEASQQRTGSRYKATISSGVKVHLLDDGFFWFFIFFFISPSNVSILRLLVWRPPVKATYLRANARPFIKLRHL